MERLTHTIRDWYASFSSPSRENILYLAPYAGPIQEGTGTPSPSNEMPLYGTSAFRVFSAGKNVARVTGFDARNTNHAGIHTNLSNDYGTTLSTTSYSLPDTSVTITQTAYPNSQLYHYTNGYFTVVVADLIYGNWYDISFKVTNITNNPLNASLTDLVLKSPSGTGNPNAPIVKGNTVIFQNVLFDQYTVSPNFLRSGWEIRVCGMSFTLSEFMITEAYQNDGVFESYNGTVQQFTIPPVGKNLYDSKNYPLISGCYIPYNSNYTYTNNSYAATINFIPCEAWRGQTLTLNKQCGGTAAGIVFYSVNYDYISGIRDITATAGTPITFTVPSNATYMRFTVPADATDIQIEAGSTSTTYEPYKYSFYGGYLNLISGNLMKTYDSYTFTGVTEDGIYYYNTTTYTGSNNRQFNVYYTPAINGLFHNDATLNSYCNIGSPNSYRVSRDNDVLVYYGNPNVSFSVDENLCGATAAAFNAWLAEHPLQIVYLLKTEAIVTTYSLQKLTTLIGKNNYWSDSNYGLFLQYEFHDTMTQHRLGAIASQYTPKTVTWNQYAKPIESDNWQIQNSSYGSTSFSNGVVTRTTTTATTQNYQNSVRTTYTVPMDPTHIYYAKHEINSNVSVLYVQLIGSTWRGYATPTANEWTTIEAIGSPSNNSNATLYICYVNTTSAVDTVCSARNPIFIDLTQMFGVGNEPTSIDTLKQICKFNGHDLDEPQAYTTGTQETWLL